MQRCQTQAIYRIKKQLYLLIINCGPLEVFDYVTNYRDPAFCLYFIKFNLHLFIYLFFSSIIIRAVAHSPLPFKA